MYDEDVVMFEEYFTSSSKIEYEIRKKYGSQAKILQEKRIGRGLLSFILPPKIQVTGYVENKQKKQEEEVQKNILKEIESLKKKLPVIDSGTNANSPRKFKGIQAAMEVLEKNGFASACIEDFQNTMLASHTVEELEDKQTMQQSLVAYLEKRIQVYDDSAVERKQKIITLVGPTGMGKTTCIMKLAAKLRNEKKETDQTQVRIISLDYFKVGAEEQIRKFADFVKIECYSNNDSSEFMTLLKKGKRPEVLFVDTAGKSSNSKDDLLTYKDYLDSYEKKMHIFLVLAANVSAIDLSHAIESFSVYNIRGVILTKLDETQCPGLALSVCMQKSIPIAYISYGQNLVGKIEKAETEQILKRLHGLKYETIKG